MISVVCGALGLKSSQRGIAIGGLICGILGLLVGLAMLVYFVAMTMQNPNNF